LKRESSGIASDLEEPRRSRRAASRSNLQEALFRDYGIGAQILRDVGVRKMIMMSDATPRLANLPGYGLEIVGSVPLSTSTKQGAAAK
jgi:3,4-dihydroxy 2-butanone 4-phosphate synthase/GTP cyclohydrolase II